MDRKYFTNRKKFKDFILAQLFTDLFMIFIILITASNPLAIILWCLAVIMLFCLLAARQLCYPIITNCAIIQTNAVFKFYYACIKFESIDKLTIKPALGYRLFRFPSAIIYMKGRKLPIEWGLDCMSKDSIKPFVEELRSKGVQVECEPYRLDNGRMMYL